MKKLIGNFPQKIVLDTIEIAGETEIADEFTKFFKNIGPESSRKIPQPLKCFESYANRVNSEKENKQVTVNELNEAFDSLKTNKSAGYDDISYDIVKNCFGE